MLGAHMLKAWSSTQPTITLSSGEAELHGVVRASAAGLGMLALMADFGARLPMRVWTDSTASIGICKRQGLGKVRHLAVQDLWVQQRVRAGDFQLYKIPGERNPADLFTKFGLPPDRMEMLLQLLGCRFVEGRPASAPSLKVEGGLRIFRIDSTGADAVNSTVFTPTGNSEPLGSPAVCRTTSRSPSGSIATASAKLTIAPH